MNEFLMNLDSETLQKANERFSGEESSKNYQNDSLGIAKMHNQQRDADLDDLAAGNNQTSNEAELAKIEQAKSEFEERQVFAAKERLR